jgi:hypothetical protein
MRRNKALYNWNITVSALRIQPLTLNKLSMYFFFTQRWTFCFFCVLCVGLTRRPTRLTYLRARLIGLFHAQSYLNVFLSQLPLNNQPERQCRSFTLCETMFSCLKLSCSRQNSMGRPLQALTTRLPRRKPQITLQNLLARDNSNKASEPQYQGKYLSFGSHDAFLIRFKQML